MPLSKKLIIPYEQQAETSNIITNIGNEKVHCIGNNSYFKTEHRESYPTQVVQF
jgi:hypothetical protein